MKNILTFDVEEWCDNFYLENNEQGSDKQEKWVSIGVDNILELLSAKNIKATFFVVGKLAEENEEVVKRIAREGHEVATHGYSHKPICKLSPAEYEKDLLLSISVLKRIIGKDILGYRAPGYSITKETLWALDIIKQSGLIYDSSIYPVSLRLFTSGGVSGYPNKPFVIKDNLKEFPLITLSLVGINFPVATTSYFRLFPYTVTKYAIKKYNNHNVSAVLNYHSWEFDQEQPKIKLPFPQNLKHYYGLNKVKDKFQKLIHDFDFISCREALIADNFNRRS